MAKQASIQLKNLTKEYVTHEGNGTFLAVDHINVDIASGQFVTLLGPSGCGKSTTLRMIAGFEGISDGEILLDGVRINELTPDKRDSSMVFQSYALFPHYDVYDNVGYGLVNKKMDKKTIEEKVMKMLDLVGLKGMEHRMPNQLSGGQQQRVALARALVMEPAVLLFDEPLSNLDAKLRVYMRTEIRKIQQRIGITSVYVTHDQSEAMALSDKVIIMNGGHIEQVGSPTEIYQYPATHFVADFIGESNILNGTMLEDDLVRFSDTDFQCVDEGFGKDEAVDVVIRPEDVDIVPADGGHLCGTVTSVTFKGVHYDIIVDFHGFKWLIQTTDYQPVGAVIGIRLNPEDIHIMKRSKYSGMFGDYSSYSAEYDEIGDAALAEELEAEEDGE